MSSEFARRTIYSLSLFNQFAVRGGKTPQKGNIMKNIKITPFVNDGEKMRDFFDLTKEEFLESYSYLTEEEYDATAEYVKEHNLAKLLCVCNHCLCAIQSREGCLRHREWDVDPDDEHQSKCDWCGETGFCTLNEII